VDSHDSWFRLYRSQFTPENTMAAISIAWAALLYIASWTQVVSNEPPVAIPGDFGHDLFSISPDARQVALFGSGEFRIADTATGKILRTEGRDVAQAFQLKWTSDGTKVLAIGEGIQVRDARSLKALQTIPLPEPAWRSALSPDETMLAAGQPTGTIVVVDWANSRTTATLTGHTSKPNALAWSPDGKRLYSAGGFNDPVIRVWDARTWKQVGQFPAARNEVNAFALGPTESQITVLSDGASLTVRDLRTGRELRAIPGAMSARTVAISPDGKTIVSSQENDLLFWDAQGRPRQTLQRHDNRIDQIEFARDGSLLATGGGHSILLWKTGSVTPGRTTGNPPAASTPAAGATSGQERQSLSTDGAPVQQVSLSPNGRWLAAAVDTEPVAQVYVWHADTLKPYAKLPAGSGPLRDAHFRDDGKLVYQHSAGDLVVWEAGRQKEMRRLPVKDVDRRFGFSRGRNVKLAIGSGRGEILIAGARDGETLLRFPAHKEAITSVDISSRGQLVVSGSHDQTARIWDADTGKQVDQLPQVPGLRMTIHAVQFSPDDGLVAAGTEGVVLVWDVRQHQIRQRLKGFDGYCRCLDFSSDSKWLVTGGDDRLIRLWRLSDGKEVARLKGHTDMITGVSLSEDRKTLASGSFDKTVKIWDVSRFLVEE